MPTWSGKNTVSLWRLDASAFVKSHKTSDQVSFFLG